MTDFSQTEQGTEDGKVAPAITTAFLNEVAAGLYHSVSREWARQMALELTENQVSREWAMRMAQELIEARKKEKK